MDIKNNELVSTIMKVLKTSLTEKRLKHTLGVADVSKQLALIYEFNCDKAYITGLLHDYAKEIEIEKKLEICKSLNIPLDCFLENNLQLAHGIIGAYMAKSNFGITDDLMLNAISNHTLGRENMSILEKILFVADIAEPNRKPYEQVQEVRKVMLTDLNRAVYLTLKMKIEYTERKNEQVNSTSLKLLQHYEQFK